MLFAAWTGTRATEEADASSITRMPNNSINSTSRHNSLITPAPATMESDLSRDDLPKDLNLTKLESESTQVILEFEDARPAVFKSIFWEVCAVLSLVSVQLANVYYRHHDADSRKLRMHRL